MFGLTFEKLLIIGLLAVFLLGPDRLPGYASTLANWVKKLRGMAEGAKDRIRDEMGPEFDEVDWKKLDPRQYDPRRIIRDALLEGDDTVRHVKSVVAGTSLATPAAWANSATATDEAPSALASEPGDSTSAKQATLLHAPFDNEAT